MNTYELIIIAILCFVIASFAFRYSKSIKKNKENELRLEKIELKLEGLEKKIENYCYKCGYIMSPGKTKTVDVYSLGTPYKKKYCKKCAPCYNEEILGSYYMKYEVDENGNIVSKPVSKKSKK